MPVNNMNTGVDYSFSYFESSSGTLVNLGDIQDIRISAMKHDITSRPYNTYPRYGYVDDGFKIEFTITRTSGLIEDLAVSLSQNLAAGNVLQPGVLNQTSNNPDGTISRYQYQGFVIFVVSHGDISRDKVVTLHIEGMASQKVKIA